MIRNGKIPATNLIKYVVSVFYHNIQVCMVLTLKIVSSSFEMCESSLIDSFLINPREEGVRSHTLLCRRLIPTVHNTDKKPLLSLKQATP